MSATSSPAPPTPEGVRIPAAGPASVYCTLYHRDAGFDAIAQAELRALGGGGSPEPGVWLSPRPICWPATGYGHAGGRQLAFGSTLEDLAEALRALRLAAPTFSILTRRIPRLRKGASAARTVIGDCVQGAVSVEAPQLRLMLVVSPLGFRVLLEAPAEPGQTDWLNVSHRPHNYLVAVPVRLAKAMLSLTARPGDTVLDPFCGAGTIPLLAAMAGHPAFGSDISAACVTQAAANFAHFGRRATLVCVDAREASQTADCIVSNPPYGLYCHHSAGAALRGILGNLRRLAPRATLVTSEPIDADLAAEGFAVEQIIPVESERFERLVYVAARQEGAVTGTNGLLSYRIGSSATVSRQAPSGSSASRNAGHFAGRPTGRFRR